MSLFTTFGRAAIVVRGFAGKTATNTLLLNLIATAAALLAVAGVQRFVPALVALAGVALMVGYRPARWIRPWRQHGPAGTYLVARLALSLAAVTLVLRAGHDGALLWAAVALLVATSTTEAAVASIAGRTFDFVSNLPTYGARNVPVLRLGSVAALNVLAVVVLVIRGAWTGAAGLGWLALLLAAAAFVVELVVVGDVLAALLRGGQNARLSAALEEHAPEFVLHWEAPAGTAYQVAMWLPYLERLGRNYFVLVRTPVNYDEVRAITSAPIVLMRSLEQLDDVVVPSLKAAFYVNTATRNCHLIRYTQMKHLQLNHGDSDKVPSFNPVFRMFDRNFVAGQAAVDRFEANGVWMPKEMFEIVGRPQVSAVEIARRPIGDIESPTVLYAPTWAGFYADSNYCSLPYGVEIVSALLARGCTVIFRPHPYTYRSAAQVQAAERVRALLVSDAAKTGRPHVYGPKAETEWTIFQCFNAADALISDVSSVPNDFLYSEKPFAMVAVSVPASEFADEFPVAKAAYIIDAHAGVVGGLDLTLNDLLKQDPLRDRRRELKTYYLGDIPAETYADRFTSVAARYLMPAETAATDRS